jgi:hypothetical protein
VFQRPPQWRALSFPASADICSVGAKARKSAVFDLRDGGFRKIVRAEVGGVDSLSA